GVEASERPHPALRGSPGCAVASRLSALRPAHRAHGAARAAAAEEAVAVGLQARHHQAGRHVELLQHRAALRVDAADVALLGLPGAVPELAVDPGDAGHETAAFDRAQDGAGRRVDLVDLAVAMLPDPQRSLGPG